MTTAKFLYRILLRCYPQRFRDEFGEQMMQTFLDQTADLDRSKGNSSLNFWCFTVTDEFKNIIRQRLSSITDNGLPSQAGSAILALTVIVFLPLFVLCYAVGVSIALIVPHPPVSGIGFLIALTLILAVASGVSGMLSYWLASRVIGLIVSNKVRAA